MVFSTTVRPFADEARIEEKSYTFIVHQLSDAEVNGRLLSLLDENGIGYTTTAELYAQQAQVTPMHELIMHQFSLCSKVFNSNMIVMTWYKHLRYNSILSILSEYIRQL